MATAVIGGGSYDYTQSLLPADNTPLGLVGMRGGGQPTPEQMGIFMTLLQEALKKEIPLDNIDIVYVPEGDMLQLRVYVTEDVATVTEESVQEGGVLHNKRKTRRTRRTRVRTGRKNRPLRKGAAE